MPIREGDLVPPPLSPEVRALLALHLVPGLGPRLTAALLERFGSPDAVLQASVEELRAVPHLGEAVARAVAEAIDPAAVDAEVEQLERDGAGLRVLGSGDY